MKRSFTTLAIAALGMLAALASANPTTIGTPRGARIDVQADFPAGPGPFPALILASGAGYHMALPALVETSRRLVAQGVAVYRFNWAYFTSKPKGKPSGDLVAEQEDLRSVLQLARAEPRVDAKRISVGGKSMGSIVAWRVFAADKSLRAGLFLTPICSDASPAAVAHKHYEGAAEETRPMSFILGDQDPLCRPAHLYGFAAALVGPVRVAIIGGDHGFQNRALKGAEAEAFAARHVGTTAQLAADFVAELPQP